MNKNKNKHDSRMPDSKTIAKAFVTQLEKQLRNRPTVKVYLSANKKPITINYL